MRFQSKGFSLIEILISLFIVSLTAVNITSLQIMVSEQQRDNLTHSSVILVAKDKMESVMSISTVEELAALDSTSENDLQVGDSLLSVVWSVDRVDSSLNAGDDFREVAMNISWNDSKGEIKTFKYTEQISLALLLSETSSVDSLAGIVGSALATNEVIYFEPNMDYKKGSFVIHDSYLYQAESAHLAGDGHPKTVIDPDTGIESGSNGWLSYGSIDNAELADNEDLATLFLE